MANNLLLTGAGFTFNWGGWLASEVSGKILNDGSLDQPTRDLLIAAQMSGGGFEGALSELQRLLMACDDGAAARVEALQGAVSRVFDRMNAGLSGMPLEFAAPSTVGQRVLDWLVRFNAIFTLNQDLLLEQKYLYPRDNITLAANQRLNGGLIPGIQLVAPASCENPLLEPHYVTIDPPAAVPAKFQPYFKLHGSANWRDSRGSQLLVMGGNKLEYIDQHPLLRWNFDQFASYLRRPATNLVVVGYGFGDAHVNNVIRQAAIESAERRDHLKLFVISPTGETALMTNAQKLGQNHLRGTSQSPLRDTFTHRSAERESLMSWIPL